MNPCPIMFNPSNSHTTYMVHSGNILHKNIAFIYQFANFFNLLRIKLCRIHWRASFGNHIQAVFSYRSKKQMIWIYTRRIIAFVAHKKVFWNLFSQEYLKSKSMGWHIFSGCNCKNSISLSSPSFSPFPALVSLSFLKPIKVSFFGCFLYRNIKRIAMSLQSFKMLIAKFMCVEWFITKLTRFHNYRNYTMYLSNFQSSSPCCLSKTYNV